MRYPLIRSALLLLVLITGYRTVGQNTLFDIIYCLNGGENKTVGIPSVGIPNPIDRPGWNLIFHDEFDFDSLDAAKWNRSTPFDDGNGSCIRKFAVNPANITVGNGHAQIINSADQLLPSCPFSAGEIKTMSVRDTSFNSFYFYATGYVEARIKLFSKTGQGAAMWLWSVGTPNDPGGPGPWSEIDVFELNGINSNVVDGTYHWSFEGTHTSQLHNLFLNSGQGLYDLTTNWTIFGIEWRSDTIYWYINNILVKKLDLHRIPPFCLEADNYSPAEYPYSLRFGTGPNSVGNMNLQASSGDLPQQMLIDYVRAYRKAGEKASPITTSDGINQLCIASGDPEDPAKIIWAPWYPGVVHSWTSPSFDLVPENSAIPRPAGKIRILPKTGLLPGNSYPVMLHTLFPGGREEYDTLQILITDGPPPPPLNDFEAAVIDSSCYYLLRKPAASNLSGGQYSRDGGNTWVSAARTTSGAGWFNLFRIRPGSISNFLWRETNACGHSETLTAAFTAPPPIPGCKWPTGYEELPPSPWSPAHSLILRYNSVTGILGVLLEPFTEANPVNLILYNMTGQLLISQRASQSLSELYLPDLKPGIYLLAAESDGKILTRKRWICE